VSNSSLAICVCACPPIADGMALIQILEKQHTIGVQIETRPLLPWNDTGHSTSHQSLKARCSRLKARDKTLITAEIASFYFPHLAPLLAVDPSLKVIHVRVSVETVSRAFDALAEAQPLDYDHWSDETAPDSHRDIDWARTFPKYPHTDRKAAILQYVRDCDQFAENAAKEFPSRMISVSLDDLTDSERISRVLGFLGIPEDQHVLDPFDESAVKKHKPHEKFSLRRSSPMDPRRCAILVPFSSHILPETELRLRQLEEKGYVVRRRGGISAIDQGRSQMATAALIDGFEETFWIDSDMTFEPDSVDRLRSHGEPIIAGIYAKKGVRGLASQFIDDAKQVMLGTRGNLAELKFAATGFLFVHRSVYSSIQERLLLPVCNEMFKGTPTIPFFQPMTIPHEESYWYLGEDYAFSHRARECGFRIMADTSIRLWHIGNYSYGWEDAGADVKRYDWYEFRFP
jgi:hypothetical protein